MVHWLVHKGYILDLITTSEVIMKEINHLQEKEMQLMAENDRLEVRVFFTLVTSVPSA
ncbi:hypothetical protein M8C21_015540, partial [Ambrosia artemisiifolia]